MARSLSCLPVRTCAAAAALFIVHALPIRAEDSDNDDRGHRRPVYQRRAFDWHGKHGHHDRRGDFFSPHHFEPRVSSSWFQRPYPYHLDYYKMRYGGSYAPYFGNLYGPPQVVTAPPYYGPYYGGYDAGYPPMYAPNGMNYDVSVEEPAASEKGPPPDGATLPVPEP
jgi:hypothetical protein